MRKYLTVILLIVMLWSVLFLLKFTLQDVANESINYVPKDASLIIHIDGEKVLNEALTTVILQPEDAEILKLLEDLRNRKGNKKGELLGIAFNSDIILFSLPVKEHLINGILVNLNSSQRFKDNLGELLNENQALANVNNVGLVISESVQYEISPLSKEELNDLCSNLLGKTAYLNAEKFTSSSTDSKVKVMLKGGIRKDASNILNANLDLAVRDHTIELSGNLEIDKAPGDSKRTFTSLKPKAFHFSTQLISDEINDSIQSFFGDSIPDIKSLSLNYFGTEFIENPSFFIVPSMDIVLEFEESIQFVDILKSNPEILQLNSDHFYYGTVKFYYKQMNDKSVYLGRGKFDQATLTKVSEITIVSGKLDALLKIEGEGMMMKLIKITTLYNLSKDMADRIDFFELIIDKPNGNEANVRGTVQFKKEHHAINEILKFGLKGQFLK